MADIARDPHADPQVTPLEELRRQKGPALEFAVESASERGFDRTATDGDDDDPDEEIDLEHPSEHVPNRMDEPLGEGDGGGSDRSDAAGVGDGEAAAAEPITDPAKLARVVLGLLLVSRDGLSPLRLAQVCETTQEAVRGALDAIRQQLATDGAPLELTQSGESFKLWTTPEVFPYLEKLRGIKRNERLSPAALETLAVIAYRQPVFRAEIESIRGVKAGPMLRTLLDCKLTKVVGRADVPGRPLQYGTTQLFLERFGLTSLSDLPSVREFKGLSG
jgi:segregation and condensation protein B